MLVKQPNCPKMDLGDFYISWTPQNQIFSLNMQFLKFGYQPYIPVYSETHPTIFYNDNLIYIFCNVFHGLSETITNNFNSS